jgi:hypothetical protein
VNLPPRGCVSPHTHYDACMLHTADASMVEPPGHLDAGRATRRHVASLVRAEWGMQHSEADTLCFRQTVQRCASVSCIFCVPGIEYQTGAGNKRYRRTQTGVPNDRRDRMLMQPRTVSGNSHLAHLC